MSAGGWRIEYSGERVERFLRRLPEHDRAVTVAAIEQVLGRLGIDICASDWGKALGRGLYEFRIDRAPPGAAIGSAGPRRVLVRVFCAFRSERVVVLLGGYDKLRHGSSRYQQKEIAAARGELARWTENTRT